MQRLLLIIFVLILEFQQSLPASSTQEKMLVDKLESWIVFDGNKLEISESLQVSYKNFNRLGFVLNLSYDNADREFYHLNANNTRVKLNSLLSNLKKNIEANDTRYAIVFSISKNDISNFNHFIERLGEDFNLTSSRKNDPELKSILNNDKIVWFSIEKHSTLDDKIHFFHHYFEEQRIGKVSFPYSVIKSKATASFLRGVFEEDTLSNKTSITEKRNYWHNEFREHWIGTGMQPVFIEANTPEKYFLSLTIIANSPKFLHYCNGVVGLNGVPLDYVYWEGEKVHSTKGIFNFPILDNKKLTPYKPGYRFEPEHIEIEQSKDNSTVFFKAFPLTIDEKLEINLSFNQSELINEITHKRLESDIASIEFDKQRGYVLKIEKGEHLNLGSVTDYEIRNQSFTISFWFKKGSNIMGRYFILGTDIRAVRQGLNVQMVYETPHFGFFINELHTSKKVTDAGWHHIVNTYDKQSREMRVYLDGELLDVKNDCPPFIGKDSLFIGKCIGKQNELPFYMDNLAIWSRSLNELEVKSLLDERTLVIQKNSRNKWWLYVLLVVIIIGLIALLLRREKSKSPQKINKSKSLRNAVFLYGNFTIIDRDGVNIVPGISPLIKEILLKLIVAYAKGDQGVSTNNLNAHFWSDLSLQKARNTRNVSLVRLRKYLANVEGLSVEYINNKHCIVTSEALFIDYKLASEQTAFLYKTDVQNYFELLKRGSFLEDQKYSWLEDFQEEVKYKNNKLLLSVLQYSHELLTDKLLEEISCLLLKRDDLHEEALFHLLNLYRKQGKSVQASNRFNTFIDTYKEVYATSYKFSMKEFLVNKNPNIE